MGLFSSRWKTVITVGYNTAPLFDHEQVPTMMDRILAESYPMVKGIPNRPPIEVIKDRLTQGPHTNLKRLVREMGTNYPLGFPDVYINGTYDVNLTPSTGVFNIMPMINYKNRGRWFYDEPNEALKKSVKTMSRVLGIEEDSIKESFTLAEDSTLWNAQVIAGIPLNTEEPTLIKYCYYFIKKLYDTGTYRLWVRESDEQSSSGFDLEVRSLTKSIGSDPGLLEGSYSMTFKTGTYTSLEPAYDDMGWPLVSCDESGECHQVMESVTRPAQIVTVKQKKDGVVTTYVASGLEIFVPVAMARLYRVGFTCPNVEARAGSYMRVTVGGMVFTRGVAPMYDSDSFEIIGYYWDSWSGKQNGVEVFGGTTGYVQSFTHITNGQVSTESFEGDDSYQECVESDIEGNCIEYQTIIVPGRGLVPGSSGWGENSVDTGSVYYTTLVGTDAVWSFISGRASNAVNDALGYLPIDLDVLQSLPGIDRARVSELCWLMGTGVGDVTRVKVHWYQTGIFKIFSFAIIVVVAIYNPVLGAKLLVSWMVSMAINIVLMSIGDPKLRAALQIIAVVVALVSGDFSSLGTTLATVASAAVQAAQIITQYNTLIEYDKLKNDYQEFEEGYKEALERLEEIESLLGINSDADWRMLFYNRNYFESPSQFFDRTLESDPNKHSLDLNSPLRLDKMLEV
jgi:hypothetical protein